MSKIGDLNVTFPIGNCELSDSDSIKARIISFIDDGTLMRTLEDLDTQTTHSETAPKPRGGSVSCTASSGGGVSCTGTWNF
ncbi:hypothetical protein SRABI130_02874 [Pseudomonas sp. Bi130]|nr:hypothetical protein SRABI130_02874 [Pseudomonas sp. Bi130]